MNDQVAVLDDATLDLTDAMTLEAWVRPTSANAGWRTVVLKEQPGDLVYGLYAAATGFRPSGHVFVGGDDKRVRRRPRSRPTPGRTSRRRTTARRFAST